MVTMIFIIALACYIAPAASAHAPAGTPTCSKQPEMRPSPASRRFVAPSVDAYIADITPKFSNPALAQLFANTLPNTLDTTVFFTPAAGSSSANRNSTAATATATSLRGQPSSASAKMQRRPEPLTATPEDTFIVTGDINAMWQRDSTNQVLPYLKWASTSSRLQALFRGLIRRLCANMLQDPYANAFSRSATATPSPVSQSTLHFFKIFIFCTFIST